ncbi:hypothetical protein CH276_28020 [Rhodococcus sp. 06-470-2]|uniref:phage gene 29 protein family protein n=1 Tax=unclassified Rhodococcus (in: high G+C Gram-positive bacteria) TaxID=192944 RepID=UPI000B9A634C|nr:MULTISPECIES: hypothetical protein [unclassified Rhodococcus (in: high G+C Gram-positive bacteria)]OZC55956.1 hypothetical protein CH276_28020 [Rhodococcus sp. 06-470-2]OZE64836.1 hypothetical protein CH265_10340 [Rhodococcus sp. 05-2221-1B]
MVDIAAEMPEGMHPLAHVFMHPPSNGEDSPPMVFEPDTMNSLGRHLERLGFAQVRESLDRYDPPKAGPIHPHNPGKWTAKSRPEPTVAVDPLAQAKAKVDALSPADRAAYVQDLLTSYGGPEPEPEVTE